MGVLLVEHHLEMVMSTCDRLIVLEGGRLLASGTPQEMLADERVRVAYTGVGTDPVDPVASEMTDASPL